ncbi:hypothetical protein B5E84_17550 [Lachnoclostridium sp. An14]|uniref:InlB B-repeat-containing protein n=1 Tax=Lachnoclostridium sp. An14 TaxID=1965562 RepID=UPI000B392648|nr:InlB B-repeat-containing protein [Lachnoclostridium sp. An14]OUQ13303.1 hypothetical protein B5E84_17550 [Lachnoclostridium sp. An14]
MSETERPLRGLYGRVNISVKALNGIIIGLSVLLIACLAFGMANRGYDVTFNTMGGTAVESQKRMYGEVLEPPAEPTREGYAFDGWYADEGLTIPWDLETDTVSQSMTLYAGWKAP